MSVNLSKGQKVNLSKDNPNLRKVKVGLKWDALDKINGYDYDLDASVFMLNSSGRCPTEKEFIFYGNKEHVSGCVIHEGDNKTGGSVEDDEVIDIDLSLVPDNITKMVFTVTIYDAERRNQNFGSMSNAYIHLFDADMCSEICRYSLDEDYSIETAMVMGEVYNHFGQWKFNPIGQGF